MKPQLHVSMLDMMSRCGVQFQRRYGARFGIWPQEEIIPPGIALGIGIAVDASVNANLSMKMQSGNLLSEEEVNDTARDAFENVWSQGMLLTEDEGRDINKTEGDAVDTSIALASLHHKVLAPEIVPLAIQERFVIELSGYPYDLSGTKDIREADCIRDTKTSNKTPEPEAAKSMQMAMYSLAEKVERGALPKSVKLDFLVKNKTPKVEVREATPDESWISPLVRRIERTTEIIEAVKSGKQVLAPALPSDWICTKRFCGYAATCPFWSGR